MLFLIPYNRIKHFIVFKIIEFTCLFHNENIDRQVQLVLDNIDHDDFDPIIILKIFQYVFFRNIQSIYR